MTRPPYRYIVRALRPEGLLEYSFADTPEGYDAAVTLALRHVRECISPAEIIRKTPNLRTPVHAMNSETVKVFDREAARAWHLARRGKE
jgi:hypothetical protein